MRLPIRPAQLAADIRTATLFCTRLVVPATPLSSGSEIARASWAFPIAGAIVGLAAAAVYWLAREVGVPPLAAAGLTLAATLGLTGCLHEDGLADVADSFGGHTRAHKLEIMRDSRIGTYGACALMLSLLLRAGSLAAIVDPAAAAPVLVAVHMASRASIPVFICVIPPARTDGLSAGVGKLHPAAAAAGTLLGLAALAFALGPGGAALGVVLIAGLFGLLAWFSVRQLGGQTGDVLGALEQLCEVAILLVAAAIAAPG